MSAADRSEAADTLYSRGESACDQGRFEEAIDLIARAIRSNGRVPAFHYKLGVALQSAGRLLDAEESYRTALELDGNHAKALNNLGSLLHARGQLGAAIEKYDRALEVQPDLLEAARNLAIAWLLRGDAERAEHFARRALRLEPNSSQLHSQLADALARSGKHDEALAAYRRALELEPNFAEAWSDLGFLCELRGEMADAMEHYRRAIAIRPDFAQAHFRYGLGLLAAGDFGRGWEEYEWRWRLPELAGLAPEFERPSWDGSDISGKTVLLYAEQGLGDVIQFLRYVPLVTQKGATVLVRCPWQLKALIENAPGVAGVFGEDEALPDFDLCCALLSLPRMFRTTAETVPARIPYLRADNGKVARWRGKIAAKSAALKVGIAWASHSRNARYAQQKSIGLEALAPLAEACPVVFYSLQKGPAAAESARPPAAMTLVDPSGEIGDFSDTAAVIENLDLVISVDTSVAHLAGAMGKPVWVLATFPPDWRWVRAHGGRNLWYPTARIFHQTRMHDWAGVIRQVADALIEHVRATTVR